MILDRPVEVPAWEPDWSPGEGDVVWWTEVPEWDNLPEDLLEPWVDVLATEQDVTAFMASHWPWVKYGTMSGTVQQAIHEAKAINADWLILRDRYGNELDRWSVQ